VSNTVGIHEAKTQFSKLVARAEQGEEIVVRRGDKPVAKIVRYEPVAPRRPGALRGRIHVAEDFDAPLEDFDESMH
jgi:prevent-host-death family protein